MTRMRSDGAWPRTQPRIVQMRENGMESVSHLTRLAVLGSIVLSIVLSVVAALGFAGRSNARTSSALTTAGGDGSSANVRLALPPKGDGGGPPAAVAPPVAQPVPQAPPVVSGGS